MLFKICRKSKWRNYIGIILLCFMLGCDENPEVTIHEPGNYNGKIDKHDQTQAERDDILRKRILAVQTDR